MSINGLGFDRSFGAFTGGRTPPDDSDPASVAFSGSLDDVVRFARDHPEQRDRLDSALIANGRYGDVFALRQLDRPASPIRTQGAEAAARQKPKPDYDTPFWTDTRFGSGPTYRARPAADDTYRISTSPAWDGLVQAGAVSESERRIVGRMSDNEGRLDSVQAWDDQIVTAGAMQKTVNPAGTGELAKQVYEFSQSNPADYRRLFSDHGWTAAQTGTGTAPANYTMSFTTPAGDTLSGKALADYIKDPAQPGQWEATLGPLHRAGQDARFQAKQIEDFTARLDTAVGAVPRSAVKGESYTHPVSDYVTSEQGAALVLDESVNRPAHVPGTFGKALDRFYAANPNAERDPTQWTNEQRAAYEPQIVRNYMAQRERTNMTDPKVRAGHIVGAGTPLSADPGSFVRVAR